MICDSTPTFYIEAKFNILFGPIQINKIATVPARLNKFAAVPARFAILQQHPTLTQFQSII